jgi:arabinan endo-1,5-alpha-L-arabinosidase
MKLYTLYSPWRLRMLVILLLFVIAGAMGRSVAIADGSRYQNPLPLRTQDGMVVESCADPSVIQASDPADQAWYLYCTTDPLSSTDRDDTGRLIFHLIPIFRSVDLVNWTYVGDAFAERPEWVAADAGLWAPEIEFFNDQYYLYYTASNTTLPGDQKT